MGEAPEVKGMIVVDDWVDASVLGAWHFVTPEEVIAAVRAGVESGTIKGEVRRAFPISTYGGYFLDAKPGTYLVIPVSDGGSET